MDILGIIPARAGSKGIKDKNIVNLCGQPLIKYTFDAARKSKYLNRIILSTDSHAIAELGLKNGIEVPFLRPSNLSDDNALMIDVVLHLLAFLEENENYTPKIIVLLQPTSPLRTAEDIDKSIELLIDNTTATSVVSVTQIPHHYVPESIYTIDDGILKDYQLSTEEKIFDKRKKKKYYARNGPAVLVSLTVTLTQDRSFYGNQIFAYLMHKNNSVDIDDSDDLNFAEFLITKQKTILNAKY